MNFDLFKILLALLLLWPRGYILIYLIDRSKAMSFGFKVFAGWVLGFAGFTLDVFVANAILGQDLSILVFLTSSVTQIFGFGFLIFLAERKILYPKVTNFKNFWNNSFQSFFALSKFSQLILVFLVFSIIVQLSSNTLISDSSRADVTARSIYTANNISLDNITANNSSDPKPLNDAILKVWLANAVGNFDGRYNNFVAGFYYFIFLGVFYYAMPPRGKTEFKLFATLILSNLILLSLSSSSELLFTLLIFLMLASLFHFLILPGNSFFYLSLMFLAFSVWTKNEGLVILFPAMFIVALILLFTKKVAIKDFILAWFFAVLTVGPWLYFLIINQLNVFRNSSSFFDYSLLSLINLNLIPLVLLILVFYSKDFFVRIK